MDSEDLNIIEVTIQGKQYVLTSLCLFHDIPITSNNEFRYEVVRRQFGLKDVNQTFNLYEVIDSKKVMLAKIKYGV